jgi:tRNA (mo5U34)-methyltransferase
MGPEIDTDLLAQVEERSWYHTIELAARVVTPGWFDLRPYVDRYGLPERMDGMRALEVGTWDGFWSFEMERRGADVVAIDLDDERDLDWPPRRRPASFPEAPRGEGFALAAEILGSRVERRNLNVYDATPAELGTFDFVFCGSVLIHLRDQLRALERIADLCTGTFVSAEEHDRLAGLIPAAMARYRADDPSAVVYWRPSARTWKRMMWTSGFDEVTEHGRFRMRSRDGFVVPHVVHHCRAGDR